MPMRHIRRCDSISIDFRFLEHILLEMYRFFLGNFQFAFASCAYNLARVEDFRGRPLIMQFL